MGGSVGRPKYMGELLCGERHGQGRMVWKDGRKYDGAFVKGRREGHGKLELANGDQYIGEWKADQMNGTGKYISAECEYTGSWVEGLREGQGKLCHRAGTVYRGNFFKNQFHGRGLLKLQDGTFYEGDFVCGQMQGTGLRTYRGGSIYEGKFVQGTCHGQGRWFSTSADGWLFDGVFAYGHPVDGEMILSDGNVYHHVYSGLSTDTKGFNGQHLEPNITRHIGKYDRGWDGQRDFTGNMIWKWADGREFRGQFELGAPVRGRLYERDLAWYDVQYDEGIRISDESLKPSFKKLAPEEVEKDLLFSRNLQEIQRKLDSEENAYEQMLRAIEQELETRVLLETQIHVTPPPTPSPEQDWGAFERVSSAQYVSVSFTLGIDFHSTGTADSPERSEFMAQFIMDLANATGTHERLFRIAKLTEGSVILTVEILPDLKGDFMERTPAEIAIFLLEQSKKPLSKLMRGKLTKKLISLELPQYVYEVLKQEEEDRRPKKVIEEVTRESPPPPPAQWSNILKARSWHPKFLGVGFHVGRIDIRAGAGYKAQLVAIHTYNMEQLAKIPKIPQRLPTPEPEYLSGKELVEQIREFVAFLYAGSTLTKSSLREDENNANTAATAPSDRRKSSTGSGLNRFTQKPQGVVRERRDQRRAARGVLELLGGNPDGMLDSQAGWYVQPMFNKKLAQAVSTAELLWAHGGIKALVFVVRGAYPDHEFTEELSKARNDKEREEIVKNSVCKGAVDIRELAAECISRACSLNSANRMRLRMKIGPDRPEGDGVLALVDLLSRGPDGSRERAAATLAVICKGDMQNKIDVSNAGGVEALLELFAEHCPTALKLTEINRLHDMAESRKFRSSSAANQQMRVTLMQQAQRDMDYLGDLRSVLEHRLVKIKEAAIDALFTLTTDCHTACENMLLDGGIEMMKQTINERMKIDSISREGIIEIESATGIIENVCRSVFQPGILKEISAPADSTDCATPDAVAMRGWQDSSSRQLQNLLREVERLDLVEFLLNLLQYNVHVRIQSRAAGALWAIVDGNQLYSARILDLGGMPLIVRILMYGLTGDQEELEARELAVGLISSMLKGNESCAIAAKECGGVARLMHLINLGDDGLGAFSTQELAARALIEALQVSEDCRTEARRSGIRQMIKVLLDSPLLHSPDDLERQQAQSSQIVAQKLLKLVNKPPHRGAKKVAKVDESWGVAPATKVQCNFRVHFSRRKLRQLRAMPITLRQSLLRIESAITNSAAFNAYCALETEEGEGGHLGARALTMDVHEWVEVLRHLDILYMHADDKHKVSKTQAIAAFNSINEDAEGTKYGRKLPAPQELDYDRYQKCLRRILKMLKSEAEAVGDVVEEEDRSVSPLAISGQARRTPRPIPSGGMFQRTHSTVLKRVRGPLVGKKSVLNFLTSGPEGVLGEGFAGTPLPCANAQAHHKQTHNNI